MVNTPERTWVASAEAASRPREDRLMKLIIKRIQEREKPSEKQAEPAPAALEPAEPATLCVGCEGNPSSENNPCAVCGKTAEPARDVEPVAWGEDIGGKVVSVRMDKSRHCTVPLYTRPPESRLREALVQIANNTCCDGCQEAALVARAALKEASDERS